MLFEKIYNHKGGARQRVERPKGRTRSTWTGPLFLK